MEKIDVENVAEETPVVEAETKALRAKWIDNGTSKTCSVCGAEMLGWAYRTEFHYCPMCGVHME